MPATEDQKSIGRADGLKKYFDGPTANLPDAVPSFFGEGISFEHGRPRGDHLDRILDDESFEGSSTDRVPRLPSSGHDHLGTDTARHRSR